MGTSRVVRRYDAHDDLLAIDAMVTDAAREIELAAYLIHRRYQLKAPRAFEAFPVGIARAAAALVGIREHDSTLVVARVIRFPSWVLPHVVMVGVLEYERLSYLEYDGLEPCWTDPLVAFVAAIISELRDWLAVARVVSPPRAKRHDVRWRWRW